MTLDEFLREIQAEVRARMDEGQPFAELAFADIAMQHMAEIGMTFEPVVCHYQDTIGRANLRLSGYAMPDDSDQLDLFVNLYKGAEEPTSIQDSEVAMAAEKCLRFLKNCVNGKLAGQIDPTQEILSLVLSIKDGYENLEQVRVFVLTDCVAKSKNFMAKEVGNKSVRLEVMDIERLFRHLSEGKPRDEVVVDFIQATGGPLPCVHVPGDTKDYDYALTAIPGETLRSLYEKFGSRLLEANVRSFLSVKGGKTVNAGIQSTLRNTPERFMAYNNGIVIVADEMRLNTTEEGFPGIVWLKGMQIVNGGQTTASLYFTKKRDPNTDLSRVRVPAKIIEMKTKDAAAEEALIADISRFANSQNVVKQSDLSANKPFHIEVERLAHSVYCPDGVGRWFYERAAGSYNTLLALEGKTPARLRNLKAAIPPARKLTKTDLAKYITAWDGLPDVVSRGTQKCFERFMESMTVEEGTPPPPQPDVAVYKAMIAKVIIFKAAQKLIRPMFQAFQANVTAYTVSLLAMKCGARFNLDLVWQQQGVSPELLAQIGIWAREVDTLLLQTARGRMISEWAKKEECRDSVLGASYSGVTSGIPELL